MLDIRRREEHAEWTFPGSIHVDAYDTLKAGNPDALADVDLPREAPIVTVCSAGKTSAIAADSAPGTEVWIIQIRRTGKGCLSYIIGSSGEAAVIDAALEPAVYLDLADSRGLKIEHVLDTHVHADHLSRSRRLAELSGATLHLPEGAPVSYPFSALGKEDKLDVGAAKLKVIHTPGHTWESMSYLLDDQAILTGDTLFLKGVERPDLEASSEEARRRARALYNSLRHLLTLSPQTLVLPGHTSEPVAFDEVPVMATLAEVRERVGLLEEAEYAFVETILERTSPNHRRIVGFNKAGELPEEDPAELETGANRGASG